MDLISHFRRLFSYDAWANREVLQALRLATPPPVKSIKLIAHIGGAERVWWDRLQSKPQAVPVWPDWTLDQCQPHMEEMAALWNEYLSARTEGDLSSAVDYVNSKLESFSSTPYDILIHVIAHSAHHRGQIASDMRAAGLTPVYTDYIHAVRQGFIK